MKKFFFINTPLPPPGKVLRVFPQAFRTQENALHDFRGESGDVMMGNRRGWRGWEAGAGEVKREKRGIFSLL